MMEMTLSDANAAFVRIEAPSSLLYELRPAFSFYVKDYQHTPLYKKGLWDGQICLIDYKTKTIGKGAVPTIKRWCEDNGVTCYDNTSIQTYNTDAFLARVMPKLTMEPRDYQIDAVRQMMKQNGALVLSPTGSGKSFIAYLAVRHILEDTDYNILITVPTISLVTQLAKDFEGYEKDGYVMRHLAVMGGNLTSDNVNDKRLVISTWQTATKQPPSFFHRFQAYICDEAHQASGKAIQGLVQNLASSATLRFGMTGTLNGTKAHEMQLRAMFGDVIETKTTRELMDEGNLTQLSIKVIRFNHQDQPSQKALALYQDQVDYLVEHDKRSREVVNLANLTNHNTLVLFDRIDHGKTLYKLAKQYAKNKDVYYISGETDAATREEIRMKFASQDNMLLFASYGTFAAGINAPNLQYLIFASAFKAQIRTLQSIGRTLRKASGKEAAVLIDIADNLWKRKESYSIKHLHERLEIYEAQDFPYTIHDIDL